MCESTLTCSCSTRQSLGRGGAEPAAAEAAVAAVAAAAAAVVVRAKPDVTVARRMLSRAQHCLKVANTSAEVRKSGSGIRSAWVRGRAPPSTIWGSYLQCKMAKRAAKGMLQPDEELEKNR